MSVRMPSVELSICVLCELKFIKSALNLGLLDESGISNSNNTAFGFPSEKQMSALKDPVFVWMTDFCTHKFSWTTKSIILWDRHDTCRYCNCRKVEGQNKHNWIRTSIMVTYRTEIYYRQVSKTCLINICCEHLQKHHTLTSLLPLPLCICCNSLL